MTDQATLQARLIKLGIRIFTDKIFRLVRSLVSIEKRIQTLEATMHENKKQLEHLKKQRERLIGEILDEADPEHRRIHRRRGGR